MEKEERKNTRKDRGITLIALVITIVILLILAGISIAELTGTGIFAKAKEAKQKYKDAEDLENQMLADYEAQLNSLGKSTVGSGDGIGGEGESGDNGGGEQNDEPIPSNPDEPAQSMEDAKNEDMFEKTVNSTVQDDYNNQVVIPAGFKITEDANNVTEGIVIEDGEGNQFVWIPVGEVKGKEQSTKNIKLSRYIFNPDNGQDTQDKGDQETYDVGNSYYTFKEETSSSFGNAVAKNLSEFKNSVNQNHGYYIGRYEARDGTTQSERTSSTSDDNQLVCKADAYVYNYVTQPQASNLCKNMYQDKTTFTSDLMNSYAWDTAIVFIQTFSDHHNYANKSSSNDVLATKGTKGTDKEDVKCNIYDIASNVGEWTTETYMKDSEEPCSFRGGMIGDFSTTGASRRSNLSISTEWSKLGFRPILYCK